MKTIKNLILIITILSTSILAGDTAGHGGDPLAAEFVARGYHVLSIVSQASSNLLSKEQVSQFEEGLKTTRIELVEEPINDPEGGSVTSVVLPDPIHPGNKFIRIHKPTWRKVLNGKVEINRFVFHEYLRVIGVEDSHYEVSNKLGKLPEVENEGVQTITLRGNIYGDLIPASKAYPSKPNTSLRVIGTTVGGTNGYVYSCDINYKYSDESVAITKAEESYFDALLNWKAEKYSDIQSKWKSGLPLISIESHTNSQYSLIDTDDQFKYGDDKITRDEVTYHRQLSITTPQGDKRIVKFTYDINKSLVPYFCPADIAFQKSTIYDLTIRFESNKPIAKLKQGKILGTKLIFSPFPNSTPAQIVTTIRLAYESYQSACKAWKEKMASKLGTRLVIADCGYEYQERERGRENRSLREIHFQSEPSVYFTE